MDSISRLIDWRKETVWFIYSSSHSELTSQNTRAEQLWNITALMAQCQASSHTHTNKNNNKKRETLYAFWEQKETWWRFSKCVIWVFIDFNGAVDGQQIMDFCFWDNYTHNLILLSLFFLSRRGCNCVFWKPFSPVRVQLLTFQRFYFEYCFHLKPLLNQKTKEIKPVSNVLYKV